MHVIDRYADQLDRINITKWTDLRDRILTKPSRILQARLAATVLSVKEEDGYANVTFSDPTGEFPVLVGRSIFPNVKDKLSPGKNMLVTVKGQVLQEEGHDNIFINDVLKIVTFEEAQFQPASV